MRDEHCPLIDDIEEKQDEDPDAEEADAQALPCLGRAREKSLAEFMLKRPTPMMPWDALASEQHLPMQWYAAQTRKPKDEQVLGTLVKWAERGWLLHTAEQAREAPEQLVLSAFSDKGRIEAHATYCPEMALPPPRPKKWLHVE